MLGSHDGIENKILEFFDVFGSSFPWLKESNKCDNIYITTF